MAGTVLTYTFKPPFEAKNITNGVTSIFAEHFETLTKVRARLVYLELK